MGLAKITITLSPATIAIKIRNLQKLYAPDTVANVLVIIARDAVSNSHSLTQEQRPAERVSTGTCSARQLELSGAGMLKHGRDHSKLPGVAHLAGEEGSGPSFSST